MLDELINRDDVREFMDVLKTNDRYFSKDLRSFAGRKMTISNELALYIFYQALYKYQVLFDDVYMFDEYLKQLDKFYKNIDNFDDLVVSINKLLGKLLTVKLDIKSLEKEESREILIKYVYDRYIVNGYYIHGFNTSYRKLIEEHGFSPEDYENYYDRFDKANKIFAKYNVINIIDKDFSKKSASFTDDFLMACYYSTYGPNFFSSFLANEDYFGKKTKQDGYLIDDYNLTIRNLKRFMDNNLFKENDKKFILDLVKDEWDLLHRDDKKISLLLVKRNVLSDTHIKIDDYLNSDEDLYDIVDSILSPKKGIINCTNNIAPEDITIINLDTYYDDKNKISYEEVYQAEIERMRQEQENKEFMDTYGTASILLIAGSLLITLGVIVTIIMIVRGI